MSGSLGIGEEVITGGFTTTNIPACNHSWKKTMDLRTDREELRDLHDYMRPVVISVEQKSVCIFCGEEKWEKI